jgi:acetyltransferase-like isoleucine patch superfamily enzyme
MRRILCYLLAPLPSRLKCPLARRLLGWDIHPTAHIGRSLILVRHVSLAAGSSVGRMNVIRGLEELRLGEGASIASRNWITGLPVGAADTPRTRNRRSVLIMGKGAMITIGHELDCFDRVEIGDHSGLIGFNCTVLTHSLDLVRDRFVTGPVILGHHAGVMSGTTLLSGTTVPSRCIVSAGSVVATKLTEELTFYRGNPAKAERKLPATLGYFNRDVTAVDLDAAVALAPDS